MKKTGSVDDGNITLLAKGVESKGNQGRWYGADRRATRRDVHEGASDRRGRWSREGPSTPI